MLPEILEMTNPTWGNFLLRFKSAKGRYVTALAKAATVELFNLKTGAHIDSIAFPKKIKSTKARKEFVAELITEINNEIKKRKRKKPKKTLATKKKELARHFEDLLEELDETDDPDDIDDVLYELSQAQEEYKRLVKREIREKEKIIVPPKAEKPKKPKKPKKPEIEKELEEIEEREEAPREPSPFDAIKLITKTKEKSVTSWKYFEEIDLNIFDVTFSKKIAVDRGNKTSIEDFLKEVVRRKWREALAKDPSREQQEFLLTVKHEAVIRIPRKTGSEKLDIRQEGYSRRRSEFPGRVDMDFYLDNFFNSKDKLSPGYSKTITEYLRRQVSAQFLVTGFYLEFVQKRTKLIKDEDEE